MDKTVKCVSSECSGNSGGKTVSDDRTSNNCTGKDECRDTCKCITRYAAGLESYQPTGIEAKITLGAGIVVGIVVFVVFIGIIHCKTGLLGNKGVTAFHNHDDFDFKSLFGFCFQLWDFLSDLLLCYSIYDHWQQESFDSPDKDDYLYFFIACATFVFVPWFTNLIFLWLEVRQWQHKAEKKGVKKS